MLNVTRKYYICKCGQIQLFEEVGEFKKTFSGLLTNLECDADELRGGAGDRYRNQPRKVSGIGQNNPHDNEPSCNRQIVVAGSNGSRSDDTRMER